MTFKTKAKAAAWLLFAAMCLSVFFSVCRPFKFALGVLALLIPILIGLAGFVFGSMWLVENLPHYFERIAFKLMRPAFLIGDDVEVRQIETNQVWRGRVINAYPSVYHGQEAHEFKIEYYMDGERRLFIITQTLDWLLLSSLWELKNLRTGKAYWKR